MHKITRPNPHRRFNPLSANPTNTAQKMKFFIKDFFSKCDQIRRKLRIWSHLLKKSLMENFSFCAVKMVKHNQTICWQKPTNCLSV